VKPTYYYIYTFPDVRGHGPKDRLQTNQTVALVIVIAPKTMDNNMAFLNAEALSAALKDDGKVALSGIYFDLDKDTLRPDSTPALQEVGKLLKNNPGLKVHVVGHTDNQGTVEHNLDLSLRRAQAVAAELQKSYGTDASRIDSFGCGPYSPASSNQNEDGKAKNRRVELVAW